MAGDASRPDAYMLSGKHGGDMTGKDYQDRGAGIRGRERIVRKQIDDAIAQGMSPDSPLLRPLIDNHQDIIDELGALDREFRGDA